jgi:acyl-homoserine-lactone acylase
MDRALRLPLLALALLTLAPSALDPERMQWRAQAARFTLTREDLGIPHIKGQSDADAVSGMI